MKETSEELEELLPTAINLAIEVADSPQNLKSLDNLRDCCKPLVKKVEECAKLIDRATHPWSQCAQRVIGSASAKRQMDTEVGGSGIIAGMASVY